MRGLRSWPGRPRISPPPPRAGCAGLAGWGQGSWDRTGAGPAVGSGPAGNRSAAVTPAVGPRPPRPAPPPGLRELPARLATALGSLLARSLPTSAASPPRQQQQAGAGGRRQWSSPAPRAMPFGHGAGAGVCGGEAVATAWPVPPPPRSEGRLPKPERPWGRFLAGLAAPPPARPPPAAAGAFLVPPPRLPAARSRTGGQGWGSCRPWLATSPPARISTPRSRSTCKPTKMS